MKRTRISTAAMLALSGATLAAVSLPSFAQGTAPQRVEITGSSIKRIDVETALPVTIVTRDEIEKSGATTAAELLDRLSVSNGQGYNQTLAIGDSGRPGFAGASLRGLGSSKSLVLLNGRRMAVYAFDGTAVDLNGIAIGAIERVEVLRDGASALYGTDAIAGVINFITRRDFTGVDLNVSYHAPTQNGDGKSQNATATFGYGDIAKDHFNVFGNLSYDKQNSLKAKDRSFSKTAYLPNAPGGAYDRTSGNTVPASIVLPAPIGTVNPGAPNCLPPYSFQTSVGGACRFDYAAVIDLIPSQDKKAGLLHGSVLINNDNELFADYSMSRTVTTFRISPTPVAAITTFNGNPVLYPAGGKYYPTAINPATGLSENGLIWKGAFVPLSGDLKIAWRSLDAGPRTNQSTADADRLLVGAKGTIFGKWDYDTAIMHAESKATERYVSGLLSESKLLNSTGLPADPGYVQGKLNPNINPFGLNDATGLSLLLAAQITQPTRISVSKLDSIDGHVSGELMQLPAGALSVSVGLEHHTEKYNDQPQAVLNGGDVIGGGGNQLPVNAKRDVSAVFGELSAPVIKGLDALVQFRYDSYSDFGNTTNPKVGLRFQPMPELLVRASVGTGFRAPALPELYLPVTQTNLGSTLNDPYYEAKVGPCYNPDGTQAGTFDPNYCSAQLTAHNGGNSKLTAEKSRQRTIGFVLQPTKDLSINVDFWRIKVDGQVGYPDGTVTICDFLSQYLVDASTCGTPKKMVLTAAGKAALLAGASAPGIHIDPTTGLFGFVDQMANNISTVKTSGVDLGWRSTIARIEAGKFSSSGDISYIASQKQDGVEYAGRYLQFGPVVRTKGTLGFDWEQGAWDAGLNYHFQSGYVDSDGVRRVGAYETTDLALEYKGIKNLKLRAGIINIFDRAPPYTNQNQYFQVGYDPTYANPLGRTLVIAANYKFK